MLCREASIANLGGIEEKQSTLNRNARGQNRENHSAGSDGIFYGHVLGNSSREDV